MLTIGLGFARYIKVFAAELSSKALIQFHFFTKLFRFLFSYSYSYSFAKCLLAWWKTIKQHQSNGKGLCSLDIPLILVWWSNSFLFWHNKKRNWKQSLLLLLPKKLGQEPMAWCWWREYRTAAAEVCLFVCDVYTTPTSTPNSNSTSNLKCEQINLR